MSDSDILEDWLNMDQLLSKEDEEEEEEEQEEQESVLLDQPQDPLDSTVVSSSGWSPPRKGSHAYNSRAQYIYHRYFSTEYPQYAAMECPGFTSPSTFTSSFSRQDPSVFEAVEDEELYVYEIPNYTVAEWSLLLRNPNPVYCLGMHWSHFLNTTYLFYMATKVDIPGYFIDKALEVRKNGLYVPSPICVDAVRWIIQDTGLTLNDALSVCRMSLHTTLKGKLSSMENTLAKRLNQLKSRLKIKALQRIQRLSQPSSQPHSLNYPVYCYLQEIAIEVLRETWRRTLTTVNDDACLLVECTSMSLNSCSQWMYGMWVDIQYIRHDAASLAMRKQCYMTSYSLCHTLVNNVVQKHAWKDADDAVLSGLCCQGQHCGILSVANKRMDGIQVALQPQLPRLCASVCVVDWSATSLVLWLRLGYDALWLSSPFPQPQSDTFKICPILL